MGSEADCKEMVCCLDETENPKMPAKKWGVVGNCDIPFHTFESTLEWIKENVEFDFIIWTGDTQTHKEWD